MSLARVGALVASVLVVAAVSCSDSGDVTGSTGSAGTAASGTGGSTGAFGSGCMPGCTSPQFCSVAGQCIDMGTCLADGDCPMGSICDQATKTCKPGGGCGQQEAMTTPIPPNLLVVLDRSCSMTEKIGNKTKWQIAVEALNQLTTTYAGQIRFGLTLFPDLVTPNCQQSTIPIDCAPGNEAAIQTLLTNSLQMADQYFPDGPCVTNIDTAMQQASTEAAFTDTTRKSYALLLTDGMQSSGCTAGGGDNGTVAAITGMLGAGVPTFVIGFGSGADPASLNNFANAGGVPNAGATAYYDAADQMSLQAALDTIANATIGCDLLLDTAPPSMEQIYVFFDDVPLGTDPANGWTYDPATNTVTFHGTACDSLKSGSVMDVQVIFGCTTPNPN